MKYKLNAGVQARRMRRFLLFYFATIYYSGVLAAQLRGYEVDDVQQETYSEEYGDSVESNGDSQYYSGEIEESAACPYRNIEMDGRRTAGCITVSLPKRIWLRIRWYLLFFGTFFILGWLSWRFNKKGVQEYVDDGAD